MSLLWTFIDVHVCVIGGNDHDQDEVTEQRDDNNKNHTQQCNSVNHVQSVDLVENSQDINMNDQTRRNFKHTFCTALNAFK